MHGWLTPLEGLNFLGREKEEEWIEGHEERDGGDGGGTKKRRGEKGNCGLDGTNMYLL